LDRNSLNPSVLRKLFSAKPEPLTGAPAVRRLKTYSAQSGYVYQYFFEGRRQFKAKVGRGTEFVFSVTADCKLYMSVPVRIPDAAVEEWQASSARELSSTECYAVAKMALFQAFDERESPKDIHHEILVSNAGLSSIVQILEL
jgi:hypothetical protein